MLGCVCMWNIIRTAAVRGGVWLNASKYYQLRLDLVQYGCRPSSAGHIERRRVATSDSEPALCQSLMDCGLCCSIYNNRTTRSCCRPCLSVCLSVCQSADWTPVPMIIATTLAQGLPTCARAGRTVQRALVWPDTGSDAHARLLWWLMTHNSR